MNTNLDAALGIDTGNVLWLSSPSNIRFYPSNSITSAGQWAYATANNDAVRGLHLNSPSSTNNTESQLLIAGTGSQSYTISFGLNPPLSLPTQAGARGAGKKIVLQETNNTFINTESAIGRETGFMWLCDPGGIKLYTNNLTATARVQIDSNGLTINQAGGGLLIKEGSNATMGQATLVAGTVTVSTTKVTANSRIMLTAQNNSGTEYGIVKVSARAATSFTITSYRGNNTTTVAAGDTSNVAWQIIEPAP